jgi:hypothetical protein
LKFALEKSKETHKNDFPQKSSSKLYLQKSLSLSLKNGIHKTKINETVLFFWASGESSIQ